MGFGIASGQDAIILSKQVYLYMSLVEKYRQTLPTCHTEEVWESRDYEESRTCAFNKYDVPWVSHSHDVGINNDISRVIFMHCGVDGSRHKAFFDPHDSPESLWPCYLI